LNKYKTISAACSGAGVPPAVLIVASAEENRRQDAGATKSFTPLLIAM
jgi:hypothetical protein